MHGSVCLQIIDSLMEKLGGLTEKLTNKMSSCFQWKKINNEKKANMLREKGIQLCSNNDDNNTLCAHAPVLSLYLPFPVPAPLSGPR